jgi:aromatic ring-opening dioxygenase catalytic subunit (LigB family)
MDPPPQLPKLWDKMGDYLRGIAESLPQKPKAILLISGHWEEARPTLNVSARPGLLFDYYGFPEHTYQLTYPAPGAPALAERVKALLTSKDIAVDEDRQRGWDHGVFIPLKLVFPEADIPILQLSLQEGLDPAQHLAIGEALSPLRDEGVLIIGSGMSYHNMRSFTSPVDAADAQRFDDWLSKVLIDPAARNEALAHWSQAPSARVSHPREEHLLPLIVAAGAATGEAGAHVYSDYIFGKAISGFKFG